MPTLNTKEALTSVAYGIVDMTAEKSGRVVGPLHIVDAVRLAATLGGAFADAFLPRYASIGKNLAIASIPQTIKTVQRLAESGLSGGTKSMRIRSLSQVVTPPRGILGAEPAAIF